MELKFSSIHSTTLKLNWHKSANKLNFKLRSSWSRYGPKWIVKFLNFQQALRIEEAHTNYQTLPMCLTPVNYRTIGIWEQRNCFFFYVNLYFKKYIVFILLNKPLQRNISLEKKMSFMQSFVIQILFRTLNH